MTQRERYLVIAVGVVVALLAGQYAFTKITGTLNEKRIAIEEAESELSKMNKAFTDGALADKQVKSLIPMSLPKNESELVGQYTAWLTQLGNDCKMTGTQVTPPSRPAKTTGSYKAYNFTLQGICPTDRMLDLMGYYYNQDYLQRITSLRVDPTSQKDRVNVTMQTQVLALAAAQPKQEASTEPSGRLELTMDEYKTAILNRNPFSPPNRAPSVRVDRRYEVVRGTDWSLDLQELIEDPENHFVSLELLDEEEELPDGMRLRGKTISWRPTENGDYKLVLLASDNGWPSASTEKSFYVNVVDPPVEEPVVEKPTFDRAKMTFLTGCVGGGNAGNLAWIYSKTDGEEFDLKEGAEFEFEDIFAKVVLINPLQRFVEFETEGRRWVLAMDQSLADAYAKGQVD